MYTNISQHGGNFRTILDEEFSCATNVTIASGYASLDILEFYTPKFVEIAKGGGISRLLLGMAFYEGLSQKKLDAANFLNNQLKIFNNGSGVYVTNGRRYHGKVYFFEDDKNSKIYVGSSNFSSSGTQGNIECTVPILDDLQKVAIGSFIENLYSVDYAVPIDCAEITIPGKKKVIKNSIEQYWNKLNRYNPLTIDTSILPQFQYPLERVAEMEKSSLNVYFGKGRLNKKTGIVKPRPWYEIELIASKKLNTQKYYPKGDFLAYTDDGYIIPMKTQGANFKNIRSKNGLQIFGIWLKGKLEKAGALKKYEPVTLETLEEYGNTKLTFYKISDGKYYMEF